MGTKSPSKKNKDRNSTVYSRSIRMKGSHSEWMNLLFSLGFAGLFIISCYFFKLFTILFNESLQIITPSHIYLAYSYIVKVSLITIAFALAFFCINKKSRLRKYVLLIIIATPTVLAHSLPTGLSVSIFLLIVISLYPPFFISLHQDKKEWHIASLIFICSVILLLGVIFTNNQLGDIRLEAKVNTCNYPLQRFNPTTTLICKDEFGDIKQGYLIKCHTEPELIFHSVNISYTLIDDDIAPHKFIKSINQTLFSFLPPDALKGISFKAYVYDSDSNNSICISTGKNIELLEKEELSQRKKNYFIHISTLLGVVLFSVPYLILNFRKLLKKDSEEKTDPEQDSK
ncbi:MAG: hypothetical protein ABIC95_05730 [archaeon]